MAVYLRSGFSPENYHLFAGSMQEDFVTETMDGTRHEIRLQTWHDEAMEMSTQ